MATTTTHDEIDVVLDELLGRLEALAVARRLSFGYIADRLLTAGYPDVASQYLRYTTGAY